MGLLTVLILCFILTCVIGWLFIDNKSLKELVKKLEWYELTYLIQQGWNVKWGGYRILSLDGGMTWYNSTRGEDGSVQITGPADPQMLAEMKGMQRLIQHTVRHGPIGSRPITDEDIAALRAAGFDVHQKGGEKDAG